MGDLVRLAYLREKLRAIDRNIPRANLLNEIFPSVYG